MNGFKDFDDFRISAWMNDGLIIRLEQAAKHVANKMKKVVVVAGAAAAVSLSFTAPAPAAPTHVPSVGQTSIQFSFEAADPLGAELASMSQAIEAQLDDLFDFSDSTVDETTLALASEAIYAVASRGSNFPAGWASQVFPH